MTRFVMLVIASLSFMLNAEIAQAAGGPLGIDHRLSYDNSGIWKRKYQLDLQYYMIAGELGLGLWEGGKTTLGKTSWQAVDASVMGAVSAQVLKHVFTRERPEHTADPNKWFQGSNHYSFPSGEVTAVASIVTPYILQYKDQDPWVWGLEVLPAYDAVARMKVRGHWQSDVLGGFVLGTALGYLAHNFSEPFSLRILPQGLAVGLKTKF